MMVHFQIVSEPKAPNFIGIYVSCEQYKYNVSFREETSDTFQNSDRIKINSRIFLSWSCSCIEAICWRKLKITFSFGK